ncbi:Fur family transcriptional regulator [Aeromicrobium sp. CTD01-1L150]|uniref:Fur family transcriptional regulator n=1 Tax=Aeromicrobium sp. CTD01-1L150 TaxID=3341830 RepID=UPI0035C23259
MSSNSAPRTGDDVDLAGLRSTRQRRAVLRAVARIDVFASSQTIHESLRRSGDHAGLSTVYRALQELSERGLIDTIRSPDGETLYRRCVDSRHHHLVCRRCGQVVELPSGQVDLWIEQWRQATGYADIQPVVELFGTCPACQPTEGA